MGHLSPFVFLSLESALARRLNRRARTGSPDACASDGTTRNIELEVNADPSEPWAFLFGVGFRDISAPEVPPTFRSALPHSGEPCHSFKKPPQSQKTVD